MHRLIALALLVAVTCCTDDSATRSEAATSTTPAGTTSAVAPGDSDGPFDIDSVRLYLTGGAAAVLGTVTEVDDNTVRITIDEVLTNARDALTASDCSTFVAGDRITVENTTRRFANDLVEGDRALFVGDPCADHRGTISPPCAHTTPSRRPPAPPTSWAPAPSWDPTNRGDQGAPTLTKGGTIDLAYDLRTALIEPPDPDLVVFGDAATQIHVIAVQPLTHK